MSNVYQHDLKVMEILRCRRRIGGVSSRPPMSEQYLVEELGAFVRDAQLSAMSANARAALKRQHPSTASDALWPHSTARWSP